jgi:transposase
VQESFAKEIQKAVAEARNSQGETVVLSFDPMHQTHNNENGYQWQFRGASGTQPVPSNTGRRRLNILGALNLVDLDIVPVITEANCHKGTIKAFLREVQKQYPRAKEIIIFLDNARYQRNYDVIAYAKKRGISLRFLPPYSPNLCLIERLWKFFKKKVVKNLYYETFEDFFFAVSQFFQQWHLHLPQLRSLFSLNFEIILAR